MIPGTTLYVYIGSLAGSLTALGSRETRDSSTIEWIAKGVGLLATIWATVYIAKVAKRALDKHIPTEETFKE